PPWVLGAWEPLAAAVTVDDAARDGAPKVWPEWTGNVCFTLAMGNQEATGAAFAGGAHVVYVSGGTNRLAANALEPRCAIGHPRPSDDTFTLYTSTQNPHGVRSVLAQ